MPLLPNQEFTCDWEMVKLEDLSVYIGNKVAQGWDVRAISPCRFWFRLCILVVTTKVTQRAV